MAQTVAGANVTGIVASASFAQSASFVAAANVSGTVISASYAQSATSAVTASTYSGSTLIVGADPSGSEALRVSGDVRLGPNTIRVGNYATFGMAARLNVFSALMGYNLAGVAGSDSYTTLQSNTVGYAGVVAGTSGQAVGGYVSVFAYSGSTVSGSTTTTPNEIARFNPSGLIVGTEPGGAEILRVGGSARVNRLQLGGAAGGFVSSSVYNSTALGLVIGGGNGSASDLYFTNRDGGAVFTNPSGTTNLTTYGHVLASTDNSQDIGASGTRFRNGYLAGTLTLASDPIPSFPATLGVNGSANIKTLLIGGAAPNVAQISFFSGSTRFAGVGSSAWATGDGGTDFVVFADAGKHIKIAPGASTVMTVYAGGGASVVGSIGINGAAPQAKPTITGSLSTNTAAVLGQLLAFFSASGFLTNSTTA
jgi:hypothetical protein